MKEIIKQLKDAKSVAIFTHMSADPDALGSAGAMYHALTSMGKNCAIFLNEQVDEKFAFLELENVFLEPSLEHNFDLALSLDAASAERLGIHKEFFLSFDKQIAIDHHSSRDVFAKIELVKFESSNCEILLDLILEMKGKVSVLEANCLYLGLIGDTGGFSNNGTKSSSFLAAAKLVDLGAESTKVSSSLFGSRRLADLKMMEKMISRLEVINGIGISYLLVKDIKALGLESFKSSDLVGTIKSVKGVEIAVMLKQIKGKNFSVSLRSMPHIDVSKVAERFGGGGHKQAAGCALVGSFQQVKRILLKELLQLGK